MFDVISTDYPISHSFVVVFVQIRGMGGTNTHPTAVEVKTRIRLLLMGASPAVAAGSRSQPSTSGASVAMEEESPAYLSAGALEDLRDEEVVEESPEHDMTDITQLLEEAQARPGPPAGHSQTAAWSEFSREGLAYVAGYLAYKCRSIDCSLGTMSSQCTPGQAGPSCGWLERLSRGGLYVPSQQWLEQVVAFDVVFCTMHHPDIDREPGVIRRLQESLEAKFPRVDQRVVRKYAVTRSHLRMRHLQRELKERRDAPADPEAKGKRGPKDSAKDVPGRNAQGVPDRNAKRMRMLAR